MGDKSIASLEDSISVVTALKYGTTNIVVKDRCILYSIFVLCLILPNISLFNKICMLLN